MAKLNTTLCLMLLIPSKENDASPKFQERRSAERERERITLRSVQHTPSLILRVLQRWTSRVRNPSIHVDAIVAFVYANS